MLSQISDVVLLGLFAGLTLLVLARRPLGIRPPASVYLPYLWTFFLVFTLAELVSFKVGIWVLAVVCFLALREYFSLVEMRIQDRWAILGAYLAVPFMFYYVHTDWYGMFILSIPVYAFLVIPFLVALGGEDAKGTVQSVGLIDLALVLLVYCIGHIGYLAFYSVWMAVFVVAGVVICDLSALLLNARSRAPLQSILVQILVPGPFVALLALVMTPWTGIPWVHGVALGILIPALVAIGCFTIDRLEVDLGIDRARLRPGRGETLNSLKSYVYVAPVAFHYLRYFLDAF